MKYHFILTLDYELFGNGSGCVEKCVVEPTERLLSILSYHDAMCTFFVDALEFKTISQLPDSPFSLSINRLEQQLSDIGASNHPLQLHLHPQWVDAKYESGTWELQNQLWRIGDLDSSTIYSSIETSLDYIRKFTQKPITTFRAGGWAIQPGKLVLECLNQHGIIIDSTVAPGAVNAARGDWYNFLKCPDKPYWKVNENVCLEDSSGNIMEAPITTTNIGIRSHINALAERSKYSQFPVDCHGSYEGPNGRLQSYLGKISKLLKLGHIMLDFSTLPSWALIEATKRHMKRFESVQEVIPIVAIGHNKNFSQQSEKNLEEYLKWISSTADITYSTYDLWHQELSTQKG